MSTSENHNATQGATDADARPTPFRCVHSTNLPELLEQLSASLLVSTYQANTLMAVRSIGGKISTQLRTYPMAMGVAGVAESSASAAARLLQP